VVRRGFERRRGYSYSEWGEGVRCKEKIDAGRRGDPLKGEKAARKGGRVVGGVFSSGGGKNLSFLREDQILSSQRIGEGSRKCRQPHWWKRKRIILS